MSAHWAEKYIGQPYVPHTGDCAALVAQVRVDLGLRVPDDAAVQRAVSRLGRAGQAADAVLLWGHRTDCPEDGDVVLMLCAGRPSHFGAWVDDINGEPHVLHALENVGHVVLTRVRDLPLTGLVIEGVYQCLA